MRDIITTTEKLKQIKKKKSAIAALINLNHNAFIIYVGIVNINFDINNKVHSLKRAQIAYLKIYNTSTKVFLEYADFIDVYL